MPPRTKNGDCIKVEDVENTPGSKYEQSPDSAGAAGSRRALHQHTVWSWQGGALEAYSGIFILSNCIMFQIFKYIYYTNVWFR